MECFFNYLKSYIEYDDNILYNCGTVMVNKLIINVKYLIIEHIVSDQIIFFVGKIFDTRALKKYHNNCNNRNLMHYRLVDDFSLSHCNDIIQTFYSFINKKLNHNNTNYIYAIGLNNLIIITDSVNLFKRYTKKNINNNINPFYNHNYGLMLTIKKY